MPLGYFAFTDIFPVDERSEYLQPKQGKKYNNQQGGCQGGLLLVTGYEK